MKNETFVVQCNHCKEWVEVGGTRSRSLSPSCQKFLDFIKYGHILLTAVYSIYVAYSFVKWQVRLGDIDCSFFSLLFTVLMCNAMYTLLHVGVCLYCDHLKKEWSYTPRAFHEENEEDVLLSEKKASMKGAIGILFIDALLLFGPNYGDCELMREKLVSLRAHPSQHYECPSYNAKCHVCPEWRRRR